MASSASLIHCSQRLFWPLWCFLVIFGYLSSASPSHGRRLICWQAIAKCQQESECFFAYEQYQYACMPVIRGGRKCPSHCISSLVQLNMTKNGPSLEDCDCASDVICEDMKRQIEPCLPRTSKVGCTDARRQCERDPECNRAISDYLLHCGKLFSRSRCTDACRIVIENMRSIPKAEVLDTCVCDGEERTICEYVKISMKTLCFETRVEYTSSGFYSDDTEDGDFLEDPVEEDSSGSFVRAHYVLTIVASILGLLSHL
ncbi:growth arrest-specific protein 1-like [Brienomyrus brachyistius]|uniref:growth arrest-specific protein 1-like n=1 Tax=Brienomyrus brachyistius TaxID=42636 RepID=UPI0020B21EE9|nr:growth arrest-specific protein 1-like [Brienomyrus brachyistius]